jgi:organic hydroperoxide reductase OsmC/OhrA
MPKPFPHAYTCELEVRDDASSVLKAPPRPALIGGNPPEFDGSDAWWSPEHLLLSSLQVCFRGTWNALIAKPGIKASKFATRAEAVLEKGPAGITFTSITLTAFVTVPAAQVDAARDLLAKAKKYCIISNQLKTEPTLVTEVTAGG